MKKKISEIEQEDINKNQLKYNQLDKIQKRKKIE